MFSGSKTFATVKDTALAPIVTAPLNVRVQAGADWLKRLDAYAQVDGSLNIRCFENYSGTTTSSTSASAYVSGHWIVA